MQTIICQITLTVKQLEICSIWKFIIIFLNLISEYKFKWVGSEKRGEKSVLNHIYSPCYYFFKGKESCNLQLNGDFGVIEIFSIILTILFPINTEKLKVAFLWL